MLLEIYKKLIFRFGPQHWWPLTKEKDLVSKYHKNIVLNNKQKLEICFGAILTQNTNWKNVEKAIYNLNKRNLIDIKKILKIESKRLAEIIKSSGYNNQKAKKLKNFCNFLFKNYNGKLDLLFKNNIYEIRKQLLSVNGIGPETADSMILYAAKKPIFVVDAYTRRVFGRIGFKEKSYDEFQRLFMENLPNSERLFNEYHALIVELGKNICKKKPLCEKCPINSYCDYYKNKYREL